MRVFFLFFCNITDTKILLLSLPQAKEKRSDTRASRADPDESVGNNNNDEFGVEWNDNNKDSDDEDEWTDSAKGEGNNKKESDGKKKNDNAISSSCFISIVSVALRNARFMCLGLRVTRFFQYFY